MIAFLIMCHKNAAQVNRLIQACRHPQVDVFVHVDTQADFDVEDISTGEGVYVLDRLDAYLGGGRPCAY